MSLDGGPDEAVELLSRQLMEVEVLQAMYPEEGAVVISEVAHSAARVLVQQWEETGEAPEAASLSSLAPISLRLTVEIPEHAEGGAVTLHTTLGARYPTASPDLSISSQYLPRKAFASVLSEAKALADELTSSPGGAECLMDVIQIVQARAASITAAEKADGKVQGEGEEDVGSDDGGLGHAVVRIDHMNNTAGYIKKLQKWCSQLGLDARLFHQVPKPGMVRIEGVYVVLGGTGDSISGFLSRLRTEYVDVNSRGDKCKERQATVLCQRSANQTKSGQEPVPSFDGFEVSSYEGNGELEERLSQFNLLHVGSGQQRFQPNASNKNI